MLDGWWNGRLAGSGTIAWEARERFAAGEIDQDGYMDMIANSPSVGHCNTMGTALTMNSLAEALGLSLTGCIVIAHKWHITQANELSKWFWKTSRPRKF